MRVMLKWLNFTMFISLCGPVFAKDNTQACVDALRVAAKSEYSITNDTALDTAFSDAFCDAVKSKRESKSKSDGSLLASSFFVTLSNDQSELSNYERTYCRDTRSRANFKNAYRTWSSVVHGDPLAKFNSCMKIVAERSGVVAEVESSDACHAIAKVRYSPIGEGPRTARVNSVHTHNLQCSKIPKSLTVNFQTFECRRTSWAPGRIVLGTSQEPVDVEVPAATPAQPPTPPAIVQLDQKTRVFEVKRAKYEPDVECVHDGRHCGGNLNLGPGAKATSVTYSCTGPVNQNGHGLCGFSYGDRSAGSHAANWTDAGDGVVRWHRYWDGDASRSTVETYTVAYTVPHVDTAAEAEQRVAYERDLKKYEAFVQNGPCFAQVGSQVKVRK